MKVCPLMMMTNLDSDECVQGACAIWCEKLQCCGFATVRKVEK